MKRIPEFLEDFSEVMNELHTKSRFSMTKKFIQHGDVSVYQHCIFVAYMSCRIANKFNLNVDKRSLIRGALLHDYFLYDWHDKNKPAKFHGFTHPTFRPYLWSLRPFIYLKKSSLVACPLGRISYFFYINNYLICNYLIIIK